VERYERTSSIRPARVLAKAYGQKGTIRSAGSPSGDCSADQLATRERQAGPYGMAEGLDDRAKGPLSFRFCALYDKVYREDIMRFAYECCKGNRGAAGVDGQTFEDIEEYGVKKWLDELMRELKSRTYQPQPVRRVWIPKPDRKQRPLGVPAIKDRVVQTAAVLVLEPIFEADLPPEQ